MNPDHSLSDKKMITDEVNAVHIEALVCSKEGEVVRGKRKAAELIKDLTTCTDLACGIAMNGKPPW